MSHNGQSTQDLPGPDPTDARPMAGALPAPALHSPEVTLELEDFKSQLSMLLQDMLIGTTADLTAFAIAYWNGRRVIYAFLSEDGSDEIDEEFDLDDDQWREWGAAFSAWANEPRFSCAARGWSESSMRRRMRRVH